MSWLLAKVAAPLSPSPTPRLKALPVLTRTGAEFETWLFSPEWRQLPDFLACPEVAFGGRLQKHDILALRILAACRGGVLPGYCAPGLNRLYVNGIIERREIDDLTAYTMTPHAMAVLKHNVSFRTGTPYE